MAAFNIDFPGKSNQFVENASNAIKSKGGIFEGNDSLGTFSIQTFIGKIEGSYQVVSNPDSEQTKVAINITQKPFIVPMSKIKETIASFL